MKAKRFIFMLLVMLMSVTGAWAQRFVCGEFLYEPVTIDGVSGCKLLCHKDRTPEDLNATTMDYYVESGMSEEEFANFIPEIVIPAAVSNGSQDLPVLQICQYAFWDFQIHVTGFHNRDNSPFELRFAENSQLKVIEKRAFTDDTKLCGTVTIPASVTTLEDAFQQDNLLDELCFEEGCEMTEMPKIIRARKIHIPASVTKMSYIFSNTYLGVAEDVYVSWYDSESSVVQAASDPFYNKWLGEHRLHVPVGTSSIYRNTNWVTFYGYQLVEDVVLSNADYAATQKRCIDKAIAGVEIPFIVRMAQNYKYEIDKARVAGDYEHIVELGTQGVGIIGQAVSECETIGQQAYEDGSKATYTTPTGSGMRLKVTKKDGKVYEFKTSEVESVDYYRVSE